MELDTLHNLSYRQFSGYFEWSVKRRAGVARIFLGEYSFPVIMFLGIWKRVRPSTFIIR